MPKYDTAKSQVEQRMILLREMYNSAKEKVEFGLSLGKSASEAIAAAKERSTAGRAIWARIEGEFLR